jgi:hypothetical protein
MHEGIIYYFDGNIPMSEELELDENHPTIKSTVPLSQVPQENGQANFNVDIGAPYGIHKGGIAVFWNNAWHYFVTTDMLVGELGLDEPPPPEEIPTGRPKTPDSEWDITQMTRREEPLHMIENTTIHISVLNNILNYENTMLEITLTSENDYSYHDIYEFEVFIDEFWYILDPTLMQSGDNIHELTINPNTESTYLIDFIDFYKPLPTGQYRLIIKFYPLYSSYRNWIPAIAEFTVEEALGY